jgi:hypothetical protein
LSIWFPSILRNRFRPVFTSLEKRVIKEVEARLEPDAAKLFERQVADINLVQRQAGRETTCYTIRNGKPLRDASLRFPNRSQELKLATVRFKLPEASAEWSAELYLVRGHFFSIAFSADPKAIEARGVDLIMTAIEIAADPMHEAVEEVTHDETGGEASRDTNGETSGQAKLSGWLREWAEKYHLHSLRAPLEEAERARLRARINAALPADYLELSAQCDGLALENFSILGLSDVYPVVMPDADYFVLAQLKDRGVLALRADAGLEIYYLAFDGGEVVPLGNSFRHSVESLLARV